MNGRIFFEKYYGSINTIFCIYKILPRCMQKILVNMLDFGKLGAFLRYLHLKAHSMNVGNNVYIAKYVLVKNSENLVIGNNNSLHEFCYIDAMGGVCIGNNVSIAHNCSLISFEHTWEDIQIPIKYNTTKLSSIVIGDDVWIGCGVRILAGAIIENRVIVAAGAVVKGKLETGYIYGGVPARKLKKI